MYSENYIRVASIHSISWKKISKRHDLRNHYCLFLYFKMLMCNFANSSSKIVSFVYRYITGSTKAAQAILKQPIPEPKCVRGESYFQFEGYWVSKGTLEPEVPKNYVLTQSVRRNLKDLVRIVSLGKLPILLQVSNFCLILEDVFN